MMNKLPDINSTIDINGVEFSRMVDYFGVWAMHSDVFRNAVDRVSRINLYMHMQESLELMNYASFIPAMQGMERVNGNYGYDVTSDGVAVVTIRGMMMKHVSSLDDGTSTVRARQNIRHASRNDSVKSILLSIDSPGGTVAGTKDLADEIDRARQQKQAYAQIEDMGASAAYWIASRAEKVFANTTALVGSIGTYGLLFDLSAYAEKEGVKAILLTTSKHKGAGAPGTAITEEQQAEFQRVVETLNEHFLRAVESGRRMQRE